MKLTGNNKGVQIAIVILMILFVAMGAGMCSRAEAQQLELNFAVGNFTFGSSVCTARSLTLGATTNTGWWLGNLHTHGEGSCRDEAIDANLGFSLLRIVEAEGRGWVLGFGGALWEHGDISIGPYDIVGMQPPRRDEDIQLSAAILIRKKFRILNDRLYLDLPFHFSNGGSSKFNPGKNFIQLGFRVEMEK